MWSGASPWPPAYGHLFWRRAFTNTAMLPARPMGLWFVNELLYWLASSLASLEDTTNTPCFLLPPFFFNSIVISYTEKKMVVGGHYRMLLYVWLKSPGLSSVFPPLLRLPFLSSANLYCGNLRQLSSAQWCKRTNLMPRSPAFLSHTPPALTPTSQAGHGPGPASSKSISQSLPSPHYHVETIMVLSGRYLLYK